MRLLPRWPWWGDGRMDGRKDGRTGNSPLSYRTAAIWGCCPKRFEKMIGSGRSDLGSIRPAFGLERPDLGFERPN